MKEFYEVYIIKETQETTPNIAENAGYFTNHDDAWKERNRLRKLYKDKSWIINTGVLKFIS